MVIMSIVLDYQVLLYAQKHDVNFQSAILVKPLAVELRPRRINAVSPGVIETPWWDRFTPEQKAAAFANFAAATPIGRIGQPEDIATAIAFLVGNSFITGTIIECDGGLNLIGQRL